MASWKTAATYGVALITRLVLAPFFGHSWDLYVWMSSGEMFIKGTDVYSIRSLTDFPWGFYTYPPVWLYWLGAANYISGFFSNLNLYILLIKLPILIADLCVALLISKIAAEMNLLKIAGKGALLWLFNPLVIGISAVWGMFDSIAVAFSLWGVLHAIKGKFHSSAFLMGLGAAVKIYPLFLTLPLAVYMIKRRENMKSVLKSFLYAAAGFIAPMASYITNPLPLIEKLLYHFGNIGSFTYWTVLSIVSPPPAVPLVSYGLFVLTLFLSFKKYSTGGASWSIFELMMITLLSFLATSAKVNVQYLLWLLPFLIVYTLKNGGKEFRYNSALLVAAGLVFIGAAQTAFAIFDLRNIGKIVVSRELQSVTFGGILLIMSAVLGGSRFVTLLISLYRPQKTIWTFSRITLASLIMVFVIVVSVFPVGKGLVLPRASTQVGVTESVEALLDKSQKNDLSLLLEKFNLTHLVFPVGPEAVMFGGDYGKSFRFKLTNEAWTEEDLRTIASQLKKHGIRPVLGIYLRTTYISVHYGYHGYNSSHFITEFSDCVDEKGNIYFQCVTPDGTTLAQLFARKAVLSAFRMNFSGLYLMGVDWSSGEAVFDSAALLISEIGKINREYGLEIFVEIDAVATSKYIKTEESFLKNSDYVVVLTSPFISSIKNPLHGNFTIPLYKSHLERVSSAAGNNTKILFSVLAMDIAEGWMSPALQLQVEVNEFSSVKGVKGYAIYHLSRYLPIRISFN